MKFTLVFLCAFIAISHQQFQQRPRGVIWLAPYYSRPQPAVNGYPTHYYNDAPYINQGSAKGQLVNQDNLDENDDYQSRIIGSFGQQQQNNARFFFNPISNPFAAAGMSAPVVMSMVTTIASIITCVPPINFLALPPPACTGRKRRNTDDAEDTQFSILPSQTLKLMPTARPSLFDLEREKRLLPNIDQEIHESIISSKDDATFGDMSSKSDQMNMRERRFFFNNNAVTSISTSYIFVPTTLTNQINLVDPAPAAQCDNTAGKLCAACLPPGYIVCPA